ncbi:hypothetical protein BGZ60DRAFT_436040 [Tricladium varicosporioides]|nr:hypothetical protein BGZ60DRAFT_436040 [Hymenoscyphus varicosporioides]
MARLLFKTFVSFFAFVAPALTANTAATSGPSGLGSACSGQTAVVSRSSGHIDVFFSGSDGRVYTASQNPGGQHFGPSSTVGSIQVALCSGVTAISAASDQIDIFVTGADTFVYTASRTADGSYSAWTQLAGGSAKAGTLIQPVSASPGSVQAFWVGVDGTMYGAELRSSNTTAIAYTKNMELGGQIAVIPRFNNPNTADVFLCGSDFHVYHMSFETTDKTGSWKDLSYPGARGCVPSSPISPIMLTNGDVHVFVTDRDNNIYTSVRTQSPSTGFSSWTKTGDLQVPNGAPIFGVVTKPNTIELFVTALDSSIYLSTWNGGFSPWTPLKNVYTMPSAAISGISTGDTAFSLFATTLDKNVSTINWSVGQSLSCGWWHIGASPIVCSGKAGDPASSSSSASGSNTIEEVKDAKSMSIGIGVVIGLLIGVLIMSLVGYFLYSRQVNQLRHKSSSETLTSRETAWEGKPVELGAHNDIRGSAVELSSTTTLGGK